MKAHQRLIREDIAQHEGTPEGVPSDIALSRILPVVRRQAEGIILRYEWLGGMGNATSYYGLFFGEHLGGVVCFGPPSALKKYEKHPLDSVVGAGYGQYVVQLVRGACVHWAHPHSASKLISAACKLYAAEHPQHKIVIAYADERAGEIGTVYQASNWIYLGMTQKGTRSEAYIIDGVRYDTRTANKKFGTSTEAKYLAAGHTFERVRRTPKGQYVLWIGAKAEGRIWRKGLTIYPYPKRAEEVSEVTRDAASVEGEVQFLASAPEDATRQIAMPLAATPRACS